MSIRIIEISREIPPEGKKIRHAGGTWQWNLARSTRKCGGTACGKRPLSSASLCQICQVISACPLALRGNFASQRLQFFPREAGEARDLIHGQLP